MGLDMYLSRETYVKRWDHIPDEEQYEVIVKRGGKKVPQSVIDATKISTVTEQVGYWRKANQIHAWFVRECQNGVDECQRTYVSEEKLAELLVTVRLALMGRDPEIAMKLLPPLPGFFFGGQEVDEWYWQELEDTAKILEPLVSRDVLRAAMPLTLAAEVPSTGSVVLPADEALGEVLDEGPDGSYYYQSSW